MFVFTRFVKAETDGACLLSSARECHDRMDDGKKEL